ncbi:MAG: pseudouridine synthase [Lachnospiraceae bacterium]|nr:pseudouridine synthase [Lachnospiraceae bacterium]
MRLNKYIAMCGVCSRRDADKLIEEGKVTINGRTAEMGDRVSEGDSVKVGSKLIKPNDETIVLAYYKPVGVTCTERDAHAAVTVTEALKFKERVTYAGRLDKDSEGLLLMTNDGDLIQKMMKGENAHEKEYVVKVNRPIYQEMLDKMEKGVYLKELQTTTRPCKVKKLSKDTFSIVLTQGLNRQIRRMCEVFNAKVITLKRVRVVNVVLSGLKPGEYRQLSHEEIDSLKKAVDNKNSKGN